MKDDSLTRDSWIAGGAPNPKSLTVPDDLSRFGRFIDLEHIGSGATAKVFRARDPVLQRWVALKVFTTAIQGRMAPPLVEARAQASIDHPNVCKVFEVGEAEGFAFIAMQWINGSTLTRGCEGVGLRERIQLLTQVCLGVHAAHARGLVHLDLKPSNILLESTADGLHPFVADFGAIQLLAKQRTLLCLGTPPFCSPEQLSGDPAQVTIASDVYSLGVILYLLATGKAPFRASGPELLGEIQRGRILPPGELCPELPQPLICVIMKAISRDPSRRHADALALREDLLDILEFRPPRSLPATWRIRLRLATRRNPLLLRSAIAGSLAVFLLVITGSYLFWRHRRIADITQQFDQSLERLASVFRETERMPPHDLSYQKKLVEELESHISDEIRRHGALAEGPGEYALGRLDMIRGRRRQAVEHFQKAAAAGMDSNSFRTFKAVETLSLFLSLAPDPEPRLEYKTQQREFEHLDRTMRQPSLTYLRSLKGEDRSLQVVEVLARDGLVSRQPETTLQFAAEIESRWPWSVDGPILRTRVKELSADLAFARGEYEAADRHAQRTLEMQEKCYLRTPSRLLSYVARSRLWLLRAKIAFKLDRPAAPHLAQARELLRLGEKLAPHQPFQIQSFQLEGWELLARWRPGEHWRAELADWVARGNRQSNIHTKYTYQTILLELLEHWFSIAVRHDPSPQSARDLRRTQGRFILRNMPLKIADWSRLARWLNEDLKDAGPDSVGDAKNFIDEIAGNLVLQELPPTGCGHLGSAIQVMAGSCSPEAREPLLRRAEKWQSFAHRTR